MRDDGDIDYSRYTIDELEEALAGINREMYPRNYQNLRAAHERLSAEPSHVPARIPPTEADDVRKSEAGMRDLRQSRPVAAITGAACMWSAYVLFIRAEACPAGSTLIRLVFNAICEKFGRGVAASLPFALGLALVFHAVRRKPNA